LAAKADASIFERFAILVFNTFMDGTQKNTCETALRNYYSRPLRLAQDGLLLTWQCLERRAESAGEVGQIKRKPTTR